MAEEVYSRGKIEDDIRAGRPEGYFDYIYKTERFFRRGAFKASKHFASSYGKFWRSETNAAFSFPPKRFFPLAATERQTKNLCGVLNGAGED
jgi:hypothetical protein